LHATLEVNKLREERRKLMDVNNELRAAALQKVGGKEGIIGLVPYRLAHTIRVIDAKLMHILTCKIMYYVHVNARVNSRV
jgi:hypothetical protein